MPRVAQMGCEVKAFLNEDLFASSEEDVWRQAANAASYPGVTHVFLMPDTHFGYGVPIGSVIVTDGTLIQAAAGYDLSCFTGDTKVALVDGRTLSFEELVRLYGEGGTFYTYSMTPEGKVTAGLAHSPRRTKRAASIVEVELNNGKCIRNTPDHEYMLRDGSYKKAECLKPGDSLMPLHRSYVQHPMDNTIERMYKVSFRELHGYVPKWPSIIHHDIFNTQNPNPSKDNDDPRFLVEMDEHEHWKLHSDTAKERLARGEIWGAKAHKLYPEMYSKMASENLKRLHKDPKFCARRDEMIVENHKRAREKGKYKESDAKAGLRGREFLIKYNQSEVGRQKSREVGLLNRGKKRTQHKEKVTEFLCPHCGRSYKSKWGLKEHIYHKHNNHKVVAVRWLTETADVYCLTVEKYGNFALDAGVFVHNCGILHAKIEGLIAADVADPAKRRQWIDEVSRRVATGIGSNRPDKMPSFSYNFLMEVLTEGAFALGLSKDVCERKSLPVDPAYFDVNRVERARNKMVGQLGSLGAGNHYVELQIDPEDSSVWVMIHTGSRGYGWQTAEHFMYAGAEVRGLAKNRREDAWLHIDEPLGKQFWAHHNSAANFAIVNRHVIANGISEATEMVFGKTSKTFYEISHNLIQEEEIYLPDGSLVRGFVHRKGSTRAFPAGHPALYGTMWEKTGHPVLIPGSMLTGAAILFPSDKACQSGCSVNHGSGRLLGRGQAKREFAALQGDIDAEMNNAKVVCKDGTVVKGILMNSRQTPLDECGHVYKDLDAVLRILEGEGIAKIARRMRPVANIKGMD